MVHRVLEAMALGALAGCIPEGPATSRERGRDADAGSALAQLVSDAPLTEPFEDDFERAALGPAWRALSSAWHIADGMLCAREARNRGVWLARRIGASARIELSARSDSADGDIKLELWGDGHSGARGASYRDASGYLFILGGWRNSLHVLARRDEHHGDRLAIVVEPNAQDPRALPVEPGRLYRLRIERRDGGALRIWVDEQLYFTLDDPEPLRGPAHDHFGFNAWVAPVCFDELRITPL
jgi:hypothetical protein